MKDESQTKRQPLKIKTEIVIMTNACRGMQPPFLLFGVLSNKQTDSSGTG